MVKSHFFFYFPVVNPHSLFEGSTLEIIEFLPSFKPGGACYIDNITGVCKSLFRTIGSHFSDKNKTKQNTVLFVTRLPDSYYH
mmetsp:Transcript_22857/g.39830  ORF Transcript_22857/g.39830 Transcript_22857/m.39830 type:complete len:83 (+) Transcript_22857:2-250(+)